jgi:nucleoid-associated protein YgaU
MEKEDALLDLAQRHPYSLADQKRGGNLRDPREVLKALETPDHVRRYFQRQSQRSIYEVLESLRTDTPLHVQFEQYSHELARQKAVLKALEIDKMRKIQRRKNAATKAVAACVAVAIAGLTLTPVTSFAATDDMIPIETEKESLRLPEVPLKKHEKKEKRKLDKEKTIETEKESIQLPEAPLKKHEKKEKRKLDKEKTIETEKESIQLPEVPLKKHEKKEKWKLDEERTIETEKESLQLPEVPLKRHENKREQKKVASAQQDKKNLHSDNIKTMNQQPIVLASTNSQSKEVSAPAPVMAATNTVGQAKELPTPATNTNSQPKETSTQVSTPAMQQSARNDQQTQMNQEKVSYHEVSPGDTLWEIAERYYGDGERWVDIWEENKEELIKRDERNKTDHGHWIYPGQTLKVNLE